MKFWIMALLFIMTSSFSAAQTGATPITPQNADSLRVLQTLGYGRATTIDISSDRIAVGTERGVWLYDSLDAEPRLLVPGLMSHQVAFSPDGALIVGAGMAYNPETDTLQAALHGWDAASGELLFSRSNPDDMVFVDVDFSADGSLLAVGGYMRTVYVWPVAALLGESDETPRIFDYSDDQDLQFFTTTRIALSEDGSTAAAIFGTWNPDLPGTPTMVWDVASGETLMQLDRTAFEGEMTDVDFVQGNETLLVGDQLVDIASGERVGTLAGSDIQLWRVDTTADLLVNVDFTVDIGIQLYTREAALSGGEPYLIIPADTSTWVQSVSLTDDQVTVLYGDQRVLVWDAASGDIIAERDFVGSWFTSADLTPTGDQLVLGTDYTYNDVQVWDVASGTLATLFTLNNNDAPERGAYSVGIHPTEGWIAAYLSSGNLYRLDAESGDATVLKTLPVMRDVLLRFNPASGALIYHGVMTANSFMLTEALDESVQRPVQGWGVAFSPDGAQMATAISDQDVRINDTATGETLQSLSVEGIPTAFSPDGQKLALLPVRAPLVPTHSLVKVVDVTSGETVLELAMNDYQQPVSVAWSPDGSLLAALDSIGRLHVWDAESGALLFHDPRRSFDGLAVMFTSDGSRLITVKRIGEIEVWAVD